MKFPKDFIFGSSTSAHQVEGGNNNDWTEWEKSNAERLVKEAIKKNLPKHILSLYPTPISRENYISGSSADHYNRYNEDFDFAKKLGHNAHRLSIEWSRIEPKEGEFNKREIEHYRDVINALKKRGIEPFITLYHWTIPIWFRDKGGWESENSVNDFTRFVRRIASSYRDVKYWVTINEPSVYSMNCYYRGVWPPGIRNPLLARKIFIKLSKAHMEAYIVIKNINPHARVGFAKNLNYFQSSRDPFNYIAKIAAKYIWNDYWFRLTNGSYDFIGINYYFHNRIKWGMNKNENRKVSDLLWELYPEGLYKVLKDIKRYKKPVYILENGIADCRDRDREWFIKSHLDATARAIREGVDVRGYFYWSLLDNFEWDKGFWPRFGLLRVDYKTKVRKIRPSARIFKKIIENVLK